MVHLIIHKHFKNNLSYIEVHKKFNQDKKNHVMIILDTTVNWRVVNPRAKDSLL